MKKKLCLDPVIQQMLNEYQPEQTEQVQEYLDHPEKLPVFMDLKVDFAFKFILGHKPILLKLLNDTLPVQVSDIEYLPNAIPVVSPKEKRAVFDVICTAKQTGERFITEMQCLPDIDMDNRLLYYGCSLVHSQVERGFKTYKLQPVYVLCISNYERPHADLQDEGSFFFGYQLREQSHPNDIFTKNLQFFFLELPRLKKVWDSLETNLERWCYLFGNLNKFAKIPNNPSGFDEVFELAKTGELNGEELKKYVTTMLSEYDKYVIGEYARQEGFKEGKAEGIAEGKAEGEAKGRAEGRAEAHKELLEKLASLGVSPDVIAKL